MLCSAPGNPHRAATPTGVWDIQLVPSIRARITSFAYAGFLRPQNGSTHAFLVGVLILSLSSPLFSQIHGLAGRVRDVRRRPADGQRLTGRQRDQSRFLRK